MDLSQQSIHDVIHPTAAFCDDGPWQAENAPNDDAGKEVPWEESVLNPKNRIDSLEPHITPLAH
ncbi:hypothetical protein PT974_08960 [Cladobotryum mycophilum]|uniref:Uncharacterized protein n=1 Tax=Cladobotryum mycophilum TaxID=491253 RepID=A0ABR0SFV1_9HYPO